MKKNKPDSKQSVFAKLTKVWQAFREAFAERDTEIEGLLTALLAREHVLLLGWKGSAKTALAEALAATFAGKHFDIQFFKGTKPAEIFGVADPAALMQGKYRLLIDGMAQLADVYTINEIFKGGEAIQNANLTLINERKYRNGQELCTSPLNTCVGTSNELPESMEECGALYDRFLLRFWFGYLSKRENFFRMCRHEVTAKYVGPVLSREELADLQEQAKNVQFDGCMEDILYTIREEVIKQFGESAISDRRWQKIMDLAKAHAVLSGRHEIGVNETDLAFVCRNSLWNDPKDRAAVVKLVQTACYPSLAKMYERADEAEEQIALMPKPDNPQFLLLGQGICVKLDSISKEMEVLLQQPGVSSDTRSGDAKARVDQALEDFRAAMLAATRTR